MRLREIFLYLSVCCKNVSYLLQKQIYINNLQIFFKMPETQPRAKVWYSSVSLERTLFFPLLRLFGEEISLDFSTKQIQTAVFTPHPSKINETSEYTFGTFWHELKLNVKYPKTSFLNRTQRRPKVNQILPISYPQLPARAPVDNK